MTDEFVFVFCSNLDIDPVSRHVLDRVLSLHPEAEATGVTIDDQPARSMKVEAGLAHLVTLNSVLSHDYERYADAINDTFPRARSVFIVNWHEGAKAPPGIFTVQTTGDMGSGVFSTADPSVVRAALLAIEGARVEAGLDRFTTWTEATHWSGTVYNAQPGQAVSRIHASVVDLEVGSGPEDWSDPAAADVMARSLSRIPAAIQRPVVSLMCLGGLHFEPSFRDFVFAETHPPIATSHILPNHWLVADGYDRTERLADLKACGDSIHGGIDAVVFHDNLKSPLKNQAKSYAESLGIPCLSHKKVKKDPSLFVAGLRREFQ